MWAGNVKSMKVRTGVARFWWGNVRKRPLGRSRCKWEFKIKTDVMEIGGRAWTALLWTCENPICEIHLTCGRLLWSILSVIRNDYGYVTL
jgi:hypothetical protein